MTKRQVYLQVRRILALAGKESPAFDAVCLCRQVLGLDRAGLAVHGQEPATAAQTRQLLDLAQRRAKGEPLQYLLGKWPFLNLELFVGEGVLCPREETELLVHLAEKNLLRGARVLDLCAGSGAVGLGVKSLRQDVEVVCGEKFPQALRYLRKNCETYASLGVRVEQMDAFSSADACRFDGWEGFLCNPPYVDAWEIPELQPELHWEPETALNGGRDGLRFYRAIAEIWIPRLADGAFCAVEIGEKQAAAVCRLFSAAGLASLRVHRDLNGFDRAVCGVKRK